jgi:hypothetical protein
MNALFGEEDTCTQQPSVKVGSRTREASETIMKTVNVVSREIDARSGTSAYEQAAKALIGKIKLMKLLWEQLDVQALQGHDDEDEDDCKWVVEENVDPDYLYWLLTDSEYRIREK